MSLFSCKPAQLFKLNYRHCLGLVFAAVLLTGLPIKVVSQTISGTVNAYAKVVSINTGGCLPVIGVDDPTGFAVGNKVLLIQMKGASFNTVNGPTYGQVTALNEAGNYEFATITAIGGTNFTLSGPLIRSYNIAGFVQLVRVYEATDATVTGNLSCPNWSAITGKGGVVVLDIANTLTISANIVANGAGFVGGGASVDNSGGSLCANGGWNFNASSGAGGIKGESIAEPVAAAVAGRAALTNGGGGGNLQNAGGGGGGNWVSGGKGGKIQNGCGNFDYGGLGGFALNGVAAGQNRLFFGGGGGGAQQNNSVGTPGTNGGGIVIIRANTINTTGAFSISANGLNQTAISDGDGGGGGGGGGTIALDVNTFTGSNLTLNARGGKGGDVVGNAANPSLPNGRCYGPGGGGSGGVVWFKQATAPAGVTLNLAAGLSGTNNPPGPICTGSANFEAQPGSDGTALFDFVPVIGAPLVPPTSIISKQDISCNGQNNGQLTLNVTPGPNSAYTFVLQPGNVSQAGNPVFTNLGVGTYTITATTASGCSTSQTASITQPNSLGVSVSNIVQPDCAPGSTGGFTAVATGGTTPYQFSTNNINYVSSAAFTGLTAGTYTVYVKDANNCTATASLTLGITSNLTASVSGTTNPSCAGLSNGSITVSGNQGQPPYTFSLNSPTGPFGATNTFTGLVSGTYTLYVRDNLNCTASVTATLTAPQPLNITNVQTQPPGCFGQTNGSINITATGGTGVKTYSLSGGPTNQVSNIFNNLGANTYTITVTDANGCSATQTTTLTQPAQLQITIGTVTPVSCSGGNNGSVTFSTQNTVGNPILTTSPAATISGNQLLNLSAQTYTLTLSDQNACITSTTVTVTQPAPLSVSVVSTTPAGCGQNNGSLTVQATGGNGGYEFNVGGGFVSSTTLTGLGGGAGTVTVRDSKGCTATAGYTIGQPNAPTVSIASQQNVLCAGDATGQFTASAVGNGPFEFSLDNITYGSTASFAGLVAGTYTVYARGVDACPGSTTVTLTQPLPLTASVSTTNPGCAGSSTGSVTIQASGGTGSGYTYSLTGLAGSFTASNTFTGLAASTGTYFVRDANQCQTTGTYTLTAPPALAATATVTNPQCATSGGGQVIVAASGGTGPYEYRQLPSGSFGTGSSFTGLASGNYVFEVRDANGCTTNVSATVVVPSALTLQLVSTQNPLCAGQTGSATVQASGGTPNVGNTYVYVLDLNPATAQGSPTFTNLLPGPHSITVGDVNQCTTTVNFVIAAAAAFNLQVTAQTNPSCTNSTDGSFTFSLQGGVGNVSYLLNGVPAVPGGAGFTFDGLTTNVYTLTATDAAGCTTSTTATLAAPNPISLTAGNIIVPACFGDVGSFNVSASGGTGGFTFAVSAGGAPVVNTTGIFTGLPGGTYTVVVTDNNNCTASTVVALPEPAPLTAAITNVQDSPCIGGTTASFSVQAAGGNGGYTYRLNQNTPQASPNFTGLGGGTYTITVTDSKQCSAQTTVTLLQPPSTLTLVTTNQQAVSCFGSTNGSLTVQSFGGTEPYSYQLGNGTPQASGTFTDLAAGTYVLRVTDANGCTATSQASVASPAPLTITLSSTPILCQGVDNGTLTATVGGGTQPYTYAWSPGAGTTATISNLAPGTYTVTVTDANGCSITASLNLSTPPSITVTAQSSNVACAGAQNGSVLGSVSGGTPNYQFVWTRTGTVVGSSPIVNNLGAGTYVLTVTDANGCTASQSVAITEPDSLNLSRTITDVSCLGVNSGGVDLTVTGGTPPYAYTWTNNIATTQDLVNVGAGNYFVIVTDANGCSATIAAQVRDLSVITPVLAFTPPACNGENTGKAWAAQVQGGILPLTYSWSNGSSGDTATALVAGTYILTVTDNVGCTGTASIAVAEPAAINPNAVVTDISCSGLTNGSITLNPTGGTPFAGVAAYTYVWSTAATTATVSGLAAGTYAVTITDANGCTATTELEIVEPPVLLVSGLVDNVSCFSLTDGGVDLTLTGGTPPYTVVWNNGLFTTEDISNRQAGTYTVVVQDSRGCVVRDTFEIGQPALLGVSFQSGAALCNGSADGTAQALVTGGTGPYTYSWSNAQTSAVLTNVSAGTYGLTVTDANGCTTTGSVIIGQPPVLATTIIKTDPLCAGVADGAATAQASGGTAPYTYLWSTGAGTMSISNLPAGGVTLTVTDANGCTATATATLVEPTALAVTGTSTDVLCPGSANGQVTTAVTGGKAPYSYLWSNGSTAANLTQVAGGTYTLTVTDANGCTITNDFQIAEPGPLAVTFTKKDLTCFQSNNGEIELIITGGTQPYNVLWNTGQTLQTLTGLPATTYSYLVRDANQCPAGGITGQVTLIQPAPFVANLTNLNVQCAGTATGSIFISPQGGTAPYVFTLNGQPANVGANTGLTAGTYTLVGTDANGCTTSQSVALTEPSALNATLVVEAVKCFGDTTGVVTINATGGTPPYTYLWSDNGPNVAARNFPAGGGFVTVRDANFCADTLIYTVGQPQPFQSSIVTLSQGCKDGANGAVDLTVSGGTPPYSYAWSNGQTVQDATSLPEGTSTVVITDANQCSYTNSVTLVPPPAIAVSFNQTNVTCLGGPTSGGIAAQALGGTPPYSFDIGNGPQASGNFTGLAAGSYLLTVTDANSCIGTATVDLLEIPPFTSLTVETTEPTCTGAANGSIKATVTGGVAPVTYSLNNGPFGNLAFLTNLTAGTYTLTAKDLTGCTQTIEVTLTDPPALVLTATADSATCTALADGAIDITATGGTPPYTYRINNQAEKTSGLFQNLAPGTYVAWVTDANGCQVSQVLAVEQPTPVTVGVVLHTDNICFGEAKGSITTGVSGGTRPYTYLLSNGSSQTDSVFTNLPAGTYFVRITDANGCTAQTPSVTIRQPQQLNLTATPTGQQCAGKSDGRISLSGRGGLIPYVFTVNGTVVAPDTGARNLAPGSYTVVLTDANGCSTSEAVTIAATQAPNIVINVPGAAVTGDTLTFTASGAITFGWRIPDGSPSLVAGDTIQTVFVKPGQKTIVIRYRYGVNCIDSTTRIINVSGDPLMRDSEALGELSLYPNPASTDVTLTLRKQPEKPVKVMVVNAVGQVVLEHSFQAQTVVLPTRQLAGGVYTVVVSDAEHRKAIKLVVTAH